MSSGVNFYFDHDLFDTITNKILYFGTNIRLCGSCNKMIENISPVIIFHNYCCYNRQDRCDTTLIEEEILLLTYHLNFFNKKYIKFHNKNINSMKYNYPEYIQEYLESYINRINKQINL